MDGVKSKERLTEVDIARGIGIVLVVIGHCIPDVLRIKQLIYLFHMPLFFFLSGYCFRGQTEEPILHYILRKVKSLYIPFVLCNCFALIFHQFFCKIGIYPQESLFTSVGQFAQYFIRILMCVKMEDIVAPLWFLPILMIVSISSFIAWRIVKKLGWSENMFRISVLFIYTAAFLMPRTGLSRAYILWALGVLIFNVGYLAREKRILEHISTRMLAGFCVLLLLGAQMCDINLIQMRIGNPITYAVFGIAGICVVMKITEAVSGFGASVLAYLGNKSLYILEWHYYAFLVITIPCQYLIQRSILLNGVFVSYHAIPMMLNPCLFVAYVVSGICIPLVGKELLVNLKGRIGKRQNEKRSNS